MRNNLIGEFQYAVLTIQMRVSNLNRISWISEILELFHCSWRDSEKGFVNNIATLCLVFYRALLCKSVSLIDSTDQFYIDWNAKWCDYSIWTLRRTRGETNNRNQSVCIKQ